MIFKFDLRVRFVLGDNRNCSAAVVRIHFVIFPRVKVMPIISPPRVPSSAELYNRTRSYSTQFRLSTCTINIILFGPRRSYSVFFGARVIPLLNRKFDVRIIDIHVHNKQKQRAIRIYKEKLTLKVIYAIVPKQFRT